MLFSPVGFFSKGHAYLGSTERTASLNPVLPLLWYQRATNELTAIPNY